MLSNNINWWATPAESLDMNPIENVWHALKNNLPTTCKTKQQNLIASITTFWNNITVADCNRYIDHLYKVMPVVLDKFGDASGYQRLAANDPTFPLNWGKIHVMDR